MPKVVFLKEDSAGRRVLVYSNSGATEDRRKFSVFRRTIGPTVRRWTLRPSRLDQPSRHDFAGVQFPAVQDFVLSLI